ncbi:MAG: hypothetical protein L6R19_18575 [Alphaproteobacteria bacterium]|nr:hypothetical protein [Alphaproteobacteria bacterium]
MARAASAALRMASSCCLRWTSARNRWYAALGGAFGLLGELVELACGLDRAAKLARLLRRAARGGGAELRAAGKALAQRPLRPPDQEIRYGLARRVCRILDELLNRLLRIGQQPGVVLVAVVCQVRDHGLDDLAGRLTRPLRQEQQLLLHHVVHPLEEAVRGLHRRVLQFGRVAVELPRQVHELVSDVERRLGHVAATLGIAGSWLERPLRRLGLLLAQRLGLRLRLRLRL